MQGSYSVTFRIYDAETAGALLWEEAHSGVVVEKGIFSVLLGSVTALNIAFDKQYYLEIKVGTDVMAPRQKIASSAYAIKSGRSESSDGLTIVLPTIQGGTGTNVNKNIANGVAVLDSFGYSPDNSVDTSALKTDVGEYSDSSNGYVMKVITGGEYCFWPQVKMSSTNAWPWGVDIIHPHGISNAAGWTDYATKVGLYNAGVGGTIYAKFRYVTASGKDYWIWLLTDKTTKNILAGSCAPDHPSYGNGGDAIKIPQPFLNYDQTKQEIILLDKDTANILTGESKTTGKTILTLINEGYKVDYSKELPYVPLHSGRFIGQTPVMIESIPSYIKVRPLIKLTDAEKQARALHQQELAVNGQEILEQNAQKLETLRQKLKLTQEEFDLLRSEIK
jgi:hypothetical protein